jgi:hypothetical protein
MRPVVSSSGKRRDLLVGGHIPVMMKRPLPRTKLVDVHDGVPSGGVVAGPLHAAQALELA